MQQVTSALAHCHAMGIIHRDIKAENVMITKTEKRVKLLDFGLSKNSQIVKDREICGTPYYMAPEMIKAEKYDAQIDIWSLGVMLYYLVSGHLPFHQRTQKELFAQICFGTLDFDHHEFDYVSKECKDLIKKMIVQNPKKRLTASQVLKHPWFEKFGGDAKVTQEEDMLAPELFKRMQEYKTTSYFEMVARNIMIKQSKDSDFSSTLTEQFKKIDKDGSGLITPQELKDFIDACPLIHTTDTEIQALISELDYAGNGKISISEFLAATIDQKEFFSDARLRSVFGMFDVKGDN